MKYLFILGGIVLVVAGFIFFNKPAGTKTDINSVTINSAIFRVKVVTTPEELSKGLGGVPHLPEDEGMLFVFGKPRHNSFWMRGMKFPLDIIFILDGKVVGVYEDLPPAADADPNPPTWGSSVLSNSVLEINAGLAKKYGIKVGDKVKIEVKMIGV